ncbi:MAG: hypothetical protein L6R35_006029, partial [Caloplaca aegaea]
MIASRHIFNACQRRAFSASARQADQVGATVRPSTDYADTIAGVAADIGHINTKSVVTGYQPDADGLRQCLTGAEIVLIPAGVPRKPGMTRDDLFNTNASIVRDLAKAVADAAPAANVLVIANP